MRTWWWNSAWSICTFMHYACWSHDAAKPLSYGMFSGKYKILLRFFLSFLDTNGTDANNLAMQKEPASASALLRHYYENDAATSFWCNDDVIIVSAGVLCFIVSILSCFSGLRWVICTRTPKGCITGTESILRISQSSEVTLKDMGKNGQCLTTTKKQSTRRAHIFGMSLQWRHNELDGISNHRRLGCLLNRLLMRRSKKTSKIRVTRLCGGNSPVNSRASNAENVSIS